MIQDFTTRFSPTLNVALGRAPPDAKTTLKKSFTRPQVSQLAAYRRYLFRTGAYVDERAFAVDSFYFL